MSFIAIRPFGSVVVALTLWQAGERTVKPQSFRFERPILVVTAGPSCAVLDSAVFAHASSSLKDLRVVKAGRELPYVITVSEPSQVESEAVPVMNLREDLSGAEFDLAMPDRAYTEIALALDGQNFVATANVSGTNDLRSKLKVPLGDVSVFDMTARGLARETTILLPESSFRFLHIVLRGSGVKVRGAEVLPSRERQSLYTTVAEKRTFAQRGSETVAAFELPAHVPIERVSLAIDPVFAGNFSRTIRVTAKADSPEGQTEVVTGTILRVHRGIVSAEENGFAASLGANLQARARVEVAVENGRKPPLPIASVTLAMRQRTICFDAPGDATLLYGDADLAAPNYHYEPASHEGAARLGAEVRLPVTAPARQQRKRPELVWVGLLAAITVLGTIAVRGGQRRSRLR